MAGNNNQQFNLIELLIMISEALLGSLTLTAQTLSKLSSMSREKKEREKKNGGKGDWVLRGEDFEREMKELGDLLQENIKYHAGDAHKSEENMTPEERKARDLRGQMLEEAGEIMNLGPKKGIRTRQQYEKYQQIKEYFLKDNLTIQKKNTKDLQEQKKNLLKNAEQAGLDSQELERLEEEYERGEKRLEALTAEQEKDLAGRKNREQKEKENAAEEPEIHEVDVNLFDDDDDEDEKEDVKKDAKEDEKEDAKEDAKKKAQDDQFHAAVQGVAKGAAGAAAIGALKKEEKSPYAMEGETMRQQQSALKDLLDENIKLRTGLGTVIMNVAGDNMNPEQQMHAKNVQEARKFIDLDPDKGISDKEAYDAFMNVKNYFLEQNISYVKASMNGNLSRQEAIRSTLQKENAQQRQEDADDRQKRQNDSLAKPEANKNEKEIQQEARKNERKLDGKKAEQVKKPEIRRGPKVNPPGIRREPTNYRELEREVAEEDRRKNNGGKASAMDKVREQLQKKKEVKKLKLPEENQLKDPALAGLKKPKI